MYCSNCGCASGFLKPTQDGVLMCPHCHEKNNVHRVYLNVADLNIFFSNVTGSGICTFSLNNPECEILSADLKIYDEVESIVLKIKCIETELGDLRKFIEQNYVVTTFP